MTRLTGRRATVWACRVGAAAALGLVAFALVVLVVIPRAAHGTALTVLTGSMTPDIPVGSVVIDRPVDPATLHVGDVATYQKAPGVAEYVTHRIVKIDATKSPVEFTFKGDANRGPDITPVPATAIRGKVWFHVPYLGGIRDAIQTKGGIAGGVMVLLAGYALFQVASVYRDRRAAGKEAGTPAIPAGPVPSTDVATESSTDVIADSGVATTLSVSLAQERLERLRVLPAEAFSGLGPQDLLSLMGSALLDDDAAFRRRLVAAGLTPGDPKPDDAEPNAAECRGAERVDRSASAPPPVEPSAQLKVAPVATEDFDVDDVRPSVAQELEQIRRLRQQRQRVRV